MALVVPRTFASINLCGELLQANDRTLRLYKNNVTPTRDTVSDDLQEADFSGYAAVLLDKDDWAFVEFDGQGRAVFGNVQKEFAHNGGAEANNVYGYLVTQGAKADANLRWVERFADAPIIMTNNGDVIRITPMFSVKSEFP